MMRDSFKNLMAMLGWTGAVAADQASPIPAPEQESAWSESTLYSFKDFTKYNPDDLIGRKGFAIYKKIMADEQVKAVTRFKRDAITSRSYYFQVDKDKLGDKEAERRVEISEKIIDKMTGSFTDVLNGIMTAMWQGYSMTEKVFMQMDYEGLTFWGIKAMKLRPFDTFHFTVDIHGNVIEVVQEMDGKKQKIDLRRFVHFVCNPEYDEHYGRSELREAYRAWFSKDMSIKFYNMWLERHASGYRWINPKDGKVIVPNSQEELQLRAALQNYTTGNGMILPGGVEFNVQFPTNNVAFKEAIDTWDLHIARAMLVPNLMGITPTGQTGSYSQSETQLEAFLWTLNNEAVRLEEAVNEQLFRQLGEVNFGDDDWPRFRFKPVSETMKMRILDKWLQLVNAKAVQATDTDEEHVRDLLDFPDKGDPLQPPQQPVAPGTQQPGTPGTQDPQQPTDKKPSGTGSDNPQPGETISGSVQTVVAHKAAFSNALKRVDFAVIGRTSTSIEEDYAQQFSKINVELASLGFSWAKEQGDIQVAASNANKFKFDSKTMARIQKLVAKMLKDGWKIGQSHGQAEIDKAKGSKFCAANMDLQRFDFIAEDYFRIKSFKVTGKLTDDAKDIITNAIINGARYDRTVDEIEQDIYEAFAQKGLADPEDIQAALGEALTAGIRDTIGQANPVARINTMVRTNLFEAINEARYSFFSDPSLNDFVEALEYSAILDGRTTDICSKLDGHVHETDSTIWQSYRPPNHYNCRSLLVPVTSVDAWSPSSTDIGVAPQVGFK